MHLKHGHTGGVAAEINDRHNAAIACEDGNGDGAKSDFVLLITKSEAVAADVAQGETKLVYRINCARRELRKDDACEVGFELILG